MKHAENLSGERWTETKFTTLRFPAADGDGVFSGYASLFDKVDLARDRVMRGAFRQTLARRGAAGIRMLWQHDPTEPIGVWTLIEEDHKGLFVRGRLLMDVARGREALALMQQGALDGLSIGFRTSKARKDPRSGVRELTEIDLWEISLVTFPMLPEARVARVKTSARAGTGPFDPQTLPMLLRQAAARLRPTQSPTPKG